MGRVFDANGLDQFILLSGCEAASEVDVCTYASPMARKVRAEVIVEADGVHASSMWLRDCPEKRVRVAYERVPGNDMAEVSRLVGTPVGFTQIGMTVAGKMTVPKDGTRLIEAVALENPRYLREVPYDPPE